VCRFQVIKASFLSRETKKLTSSLGIFKRQVFVALLATVFFPRSTAKYTDILYSDDLTAHRLSNQRSHRKTSNSPPNRSATAFENSLLAYYFLPALTKRLFKVLALAYVMLQDLAQVDQLISELDALTGIEAQNAAEQLMQTCSANGAAFQHLEERLCDAAISERARNQIHLIIAKIRTWMNLHNTYGWKEPSYT